MWQFILFFMFFGGDGDPAGSSNPNRKGFDIITSERGKQVVLRAGYKYNKRRTNKDNATKWLCTKRGTCKAVLVIASNNCIVKEDKHDCKPDFVTNQLQMELETCIQKVTTDCTVPIPSVVREAVADIQDKGLDLIKKLPKKKTVERILYRRRNRSLDMKKVSFNTTTDVIIPPRFQSFELADYSHYTTRILVFAGKYCKDILKKPNLTVICDGTFKFCLRLFQQLYTLHVDLGSSATHSNIIPVLYALLPSKTTNIYVTLSNLIKSQIPEFDPQTFVLDFEQSAIKALKRVFPKTNIKGCYFHFTQSLWRKADRLGIKKKLN